MKNVRSSHPRLFFSKKEKKQIVLAIREAESKTSGEIRLHLEKGKETDVVAQARKIFEEKGMTKTAARNGVLIYLSTQKHAFAVIGDTGINEKVPAGFWDSIVAVMQSHFKENRFADGLCEGIDHIGQKLQTYFPCQKDDLNELSDEIS